MEMGQENVIALLLQQQEEVLREIRDQKKVRKQELRRCTRHRHMFASLGVYMLFVARW